MRLLNTITYTLTTFYDEFIPPYTILSHTWSSNELALQDILNLQQARTLPGFQKILDCCSRSLRDGYEWTWCDTVCIDKTSSSELSEAINSMWRWYQHAEICYVFLEDVDCRCSREVEGEKGCAVFEKSRWFTRGWTLQELIAPQIVEFYSVQWEEIGTKFSLSAVLARITGIDVGVLKGLHVGNRCIAERMSWASRRSTTRSEDRAYSLMGIFDVNMPMLYGEGGEKAFLRLQEHILKGSDDYTLFAWTGSGDSYYGMLAISPDEFRRENAAIYSDLKLNPRIEHDYLGLGRDGDTTANTTNAQNTDIASVTSQGMRLNLAVRNSEDGLLAYLNCWRMEDKHMLCIRLVRLIFGRTLEYARVRADSFIFDPPEKTQNIRLTSVWSGETPAEMGFYSYTTLNVKDPSLTYRRDLLARPGMIWCNFPVWLQAFDESIIKLGELINLNMSRRFDQRLSLKVTGSVKVHRESTVMFLVLYGHTLSLMPRPWCHVVTEDLETESPVSHFHKINTVTDRVRKDVGDTFLVNASVRKQRTDAGAARPKESWSSTKYSTITFMVNISVSIKGEALETQRDEPQQAMQLYDERDVQLRKLGCFTISD